jgi:phospholipase C
MRILYPVLLVLVILTAAILQGCVGLTGPAEPPANNPAGLQAINHIIFMLQENRSFDHYFGKLNDYRAANGLPQDVDGLPANASNPSADGTSMVDAYHLITQCIENPSPSWNESHRAWNVSDPSSPTATLDGFVFAAAHDAIAGGLNDTAGIRVMGYYDSSDLPYYYFMASNFGTSDRWFSPVMTRTPPNRFYLISGTSAGHVYQLPQGSPKLTNKTIFQLLDEHNISWKVYATDFQPGPLTYFSAFTYFGSHTDKVVPVSEYLQDVANGTLPQVAMIESGYATGRDEHPGFASIRKGSNYAASLINALMNSVSWKDSAFILTYDEAGGIYDHVAPQPTVSPDGIPPSDLQPTDFCSPGVGDGAVNCDFTFTGYRVPLIVVSPFTKKNFVSHTVADYTAILKMIESRFGLPSLTARDAAQMDMSEFFDTQTAPWATPPTPPAQPTGGPCYLDHLP